MKEYKMSEKQIEMEKRKRLIYAAPIILVALIAGFAIGFSRSDYKNVYITLLPAILITIIAVIIGIRQSNKINNDTLSSYKIELFDNSIRKHQKNTPVIEIEKSEVISIIEIANKGITIKTNNITKHIYIPVHVEGYEELKESLSEWMNITTYERSHEQLLQIISVAGVILGLVVVMLCDYSYIVIPVGIIMIIVLLGAIIGNLINPHMDARIKRDSLIVLLPIIMILFRILSFIL